MPRDCLIVGYVGTSYIQHLVPSAGFNCVKQSNIGLTKTSNEKKMLGTDFIRIFTSDKNWPIGANI